MNIGKMDKRIQILKRYLIDDGIQTKETYAPLKQVWASVEYLSDGERIRAATAERNMQIRFVIRASKSFDLDNTFRIHFKGSTYDIDGVKPVNGSEEFLEVTAGSAK
ncbi:phage head closure protein [Cereibacter changlensis]|uniref:phage head closure protein n=1 Tax=Cereibacter changlensis TaxID=402884 RepID=UPI0040338174